MIKSERATDIVTTLRSANYQAYWVGGCVRDLLLGKEPKDYDIVTDARPEDIARLFPTVREVGKQFGVMLVSFPEGEFEVATFRGERAYTDKRRPDEVFWTDAKGDVQRRDFTVNGLLYDPETEQITDYVGGQRDLEQRLIRFIGSPAGRVQEDPLRILRAIRLKNTLGFQYEKQTFEALRAHAVELAHVAGERVGDELARMMGDASRHQVIRDLDRAGILPVLLPELDALKGTPQPAEFHQEGDVFDHSLRALKTLPADAPAFLAWAVLLHDIGKPQVISYKGDRITTYGHAQKSAEIAEQILRRLRATKTEIDTVTWLIAHHMKLKEIDAMRPAKRELYVLDPKFPWLLELHHADAAGAQPVDLSLYEKTLKLYQRLKKEHEEQSRLAPPVLVDGHDLTRELGIDPGPLVGELLEHIRDAQLHKRVETREEAITLAKTLVAERT